MPTSFAENIRRMELLVGNLTSVLEELPQSRDKHTALTDLLARAKQFDDNEEMLRGQLRDATARRRELTDEGRRIRRELAATLQAHYGFDNERLIQFGVRPQVRSRRKTALKVRNEANQAVDTARSAAKPPKAA